ncbi:MAG: YPDG domain-containing protein [Corynebacterium sp.]|uniref:Rib/alpha-like domain-containing protein n=1 Tax=Corynebacterium sp. TaxID=1720 RepID=UPI0026DF49E0|nr:Rib/alpha-like domain-containing protein [Corynebacterium sp.]MDO5670139.1 YPDG domain-containing protein [Corynebacterium sp.]
MRLPRLLALPVSLAVAAATLTVPQLASADPEIGPGCTITSRNNPNVGGYYYPPRLYTVVKPAWAAQETGSYFPWVWHTNREYWLEDAVTVIDPGSTDATVETLPVGTVIPHQDDDLVPGVHPKKVEVTHTSPLVGNGDGTYSVDASALNNQDREATTVLGWKISQPSNPTLTTTANIRPRPEMDDDCQLLQAASTGIPVVVPADSQGHPLTLQFLNGAPTDYERIELRVTIPGLGELVTDAQWEQLWEQHRRPGETGPVEKVEAYLDDQGQAHVSVPGWLLRATSALWLNSWANPRPGETVEWDLYRNPVNLRSPAYVLLQDTQGAGYLDATTTAGTKVDVAQTGNPNLSPETTFTLGEITDPTADGWVYTVDPATGTVSVTPPETAAVGDSLTVPVTVTYFSPAQEDQTAEDLTVTVTVIGEQIPEVPPVVPGEGSTGSSSDRCVSTIAAVGLPFAILFPLGLATQVNVPGLTPMVDTLRDSLQDANSQLQRQAGVFDPQLAAQIERFTADGALERIGLLAAGALALGIIGEACLSEDGSSLSSAD